MHISQGVNGGQGGNHQDVDQMEGSAQPWHLGETADLDNVGGQLSCNSVQGGQECSALVVVNTIGISRNDAFDSILRAHQPRRNWPCIAFQG